MNLPADPMDYGQLQICKGFRNSLLATFLLPQLSLHVGESDCQVYAMLFG